MPSNTPDQDSSGTEKKNIHFGSFKNDEGYKPDTAYSFCLEIGSEYIPVVATLCQLQDSRQPWLYVMAPMVFMYDPKGDMMFDPLVKMASLHRPTKIPSHRIIAVQEADDELASLYFEAKVKQALKAETASDFRAASEPVSN